MEKCRAGADFATLALRRLFPGSEAEGLLDNCRRLSEQFRAFGLNHMLIFAFMVIVIVRFFREGLWGLATLTARTLRPEPRRRDREATAGGS